MGFLPLAGKMSVTKGVSNLYHMFLHRGSISTFTDVSPFSSAFAAGIMIANVDSDRSNVKLKANI